MYHVPAGAHGRLLDAPGIAILERSAGRRSRWWVVVIVLAVGLTILPLSLFAFGPGPHSLGGDGREHLLGGTEEVTAQVDAAVVDGYCRRQSRDRYRLELSWQSGPPPGHSAYLVCGEEFAVGDRVQVWVDSGGAVFLDTPNEARFGMGGLGLVLGIATVGVGAATLVPARGRRQQLLAAAHAPLLPPVPVLAAPNKSRQLGFPFRPAPQVGGVAPPMWAISILYAAPGQPPKLTSMRTLTGEWHFRAGPLVESGHQFGVLERGEERCWVQARPLRGNARRWTG